MKSTGLRRNVGHDGVDKNAEPIVELTVEGIIDSSVLPRFAGVDGPELVPVSAPTRTICCWCGRASCPRTSSRSRRDYIWAQNATVIQRACEGMGRDRVRQKLARTYRKRWDGRRFYYVNLKTDERLDRRPRLIGMLFPRSVF